MVWASVGRLHVGCGRRVPMDDVLSVPLHRERLSRARRPIHEDGAILAIYEGVAEYAAIDLGEHLLLRRLWVEDLFEAVDFLVAFVGRASPEAAIPDHDLRLMTIDD